MKNTVHASATPFTSFPPYINNDSLFFGFSMHMITSNLQESHSGLFLSPYINNDSLFFGFSVQMITSKLQEPSRLEIYQHSRKQKIVFSCPIKYRKLRFSDQESADACWAYVHFWASGYAGLMGQQLLSLTTFRDMPKHATAVKTIIRLKIHHPSRHFHCA